MAVQTSQKVEAKPTPETMFQNYMGADLRILDHNMFVAEAQTAIEQGAAAIVAPVKEELTKLRKTIPKLSDAEFQTKTVADLRAAQKGKRDAIAKTGLAKEINTKKTAFLKSGTVMFQGKTMSVAKVQRRILDAQDLIVEDTAAKAEIRKAMGVKDQPAPKLHVERLYGQ